MAEGDLTERARARARELARDADVRLRPPSGLSVAPAPAALRMVSGRVTAGRDPRLPAPGTVLRRTFQGHEYRVTALPGGFEHDCRTYRSLSAVAHAITARTGTDSCSSGSRSRGGPMTTRTKDATKPVRCASGQLLLWSGEVPSQKWMNLYTKVLSRFASSNELQLTVSFKAKPGDSQAQTRLEEVRAALRELGLDDNVELR